jgi:hypothetical protein
MPKSDKIYITLTAIGIAAVLGSVLGNGLVWDDVYLVKPPGDLGLYRSCPNR